MRCAASRHCCARSWSSLPSSASSNPSSHNTVMLCSGLLRSCVKIAISSSKASRSAMARWGDTGAAGGSRATMTSPRGPGTPVFEVGCRFEQGLHSPIKHSRLPLAGVHETTRRAYLPSHLMGSRRVRQHVNPLGLRFLEPRARKIYVPSQIRTGAVVEVELGCADAKFSFDLARLHPERFVVGLEIREKLVAA